MSVEPEATLSSDRPFEGDLTVTLAGVWRTGRAGPSTQAIADLLADDKIARVRFDSRHLDAWDSSLAVFLSALADRCAATGIHVDTRGLPDGVRRLLALSRSRPRKTEAQRPADRPPLLARVGEKGIRAARAFRETVDFIGELGISAMRLLTGRTQAQSADVWHVIQECGWKALPIVSLISLLVGLILAFVGAVQLQLFGAQIYVADLVGIGMSREMGAIMTGVIMAGRTGAAFAANLGTMQVNEEIDALKTLGVSPMDYLVLPRVTALVLMMPLLNVYAVFVGLLGGMMVAVGAFDLSALQYLHETQSSLTLTHIGIGIGKSILFGFIVAFCGCLQGMRCGRSAAAVGEAATAAVVTAIVYIVVTDGILAVVTNLLGI
jgi:phospholipid/cholesterol/gamma-HCH transport system permease protein